ncbi:MAG: hypothetical protein ACLFUH_03025, partial [Bacteroidales bacterium]
RDSEISGGTTISDIPNRNGDPDANYAEADFKYDVSRDANGEKIYVPDSIIFGSQTDKKGGPLGSKFIDIDLIIAPEQVFEIDIENISGNKNDYLGIEILWYEAEEGYYNGG